MKLLNYTLFEAKMRNVSFSNNKHINNIIDSEFEDGVLLPMVYIKNDNKLIHINWNHKNGHDIKKKIKERSQFSGIKEFNVLLTNMLIELFSDRFGELEEDVILYDLCMSESNMHVVTKIEYDKLFVNSEILIVTILPQYGKVDKVIEFDI